MRDILEGEIWGELNIHSRSRDARSRILSSLANRPFSIGRQMFASVEGFFQGIKFKNGDLRRKRAFASSFGYAQKFGEQASRKYIWWDAKRIVYGSSRHKQIIELGFRASFKQNPDRMAALLATKGLKLRHETGKKDESDTPLNKEEFCELLTKIRDEVPSVAYRTTRCKHRC